MRAYSATDAHGRGQIAERLRALADHVEAGGDGSSVVCVICPDDTPPSAIVLAPGAFGALMHAAEYLTRIVDDVPATSTSL